MMQRTKFVTSINDRVTDANRRIGEDVFSAGEMLSKGLQVFVPGAGAGIWIERGHRRDDQATS
jgi:hypothetical protein